MARILAVDFGEKRIGLATSDASGSLATPRLTLPRKDDGAAAERLRKFCEEEDVELVVFGIPRSPDGRESPFADRIRSFARKFAAKTSLPVLFHEETLTSDEAARRGIGGPRADHQRKTHGRRQRRVRTALTSPPKPRQSLDPAAAAVLLEDFLDHRARSSKGR